MSAKIMPHWDFFTQNFTRDNLWVTLNNLSGVQEHGEEDRPEERGPHHQRQVQVWGVRGGSSLPDCHLHQSPDCSRWGKLRNWKKELMVLNVFLWILFFCWKSASRNGVGPQVLTDVGLSGQIVLGNIQHYSAFFVTVSKTHFQTGTFSELS